MSYFFRGKIKFLRIIDKALKTDWHIRLKNKSRGFHEVNYRFTDSQIAFIHLPKTGGTSLDKIFFTDKDQRFVNLDMHRPISCFCSVSAYKYITIMRDPIDRVWSYYQMVLRNPDDRHYRHVVNFGLEYFITHCWEVRNLACRYYSGEIRREPNTQTLTKAFNSLKAFDFVMFFENFESDANDLIKHYSIECKMIPHERKSKYKSPDANDRFVISKYNMLDIELYQRAAIFWGCK